MLHSIPLYGVAPQVLCDSLGVPCSLVRGEYSRHWNEVSIGQDSLPNPETSPNTHDQESLATANKDPISTQKVLIPPQEDPVTSNPLKKSSDSSNPPPKHKNTSTDLLTDTDHEPHKKDGNSAYNKDTSPDTPDKATSPTPDTKANSAQQTIHQLFVVDVMFNPGELLPSNSPQALQYQHVI